MGPPRRGGAPPTSKSQIDSKPVMRQLHVDLTAAGQDFSPEMSEYHALHAEPVLVFCNPRVIEMGVQPRLEKRTKF